MLSEEFMYFFCCNISNTWNSVLSRFPSTEKWVIKTRRCRVFFLRTGYVTILSVTLKSPKTYLSQWKRKNKGPVFNITLLVP